jgi:phosphatidate cytidylyltransferase
MSEELARRIWGLPSLWQDTVALGLIGAIIAALGVAALVIGVLGARGRFSPGTRRELRDRVRTWALLVAAMLLPLVLGPAWVILAVGVLGLLCYREFARATGLFRHLSIGLLVVSGILLVTLATLDHWYGFFVALPALGTICLAAFAILADQPRGYIQRVGLGCLAFLLFGVCLGHLGYLANDARFRSLILLVLVAVSLNDVFAYLSGKAIGRRKLLPLTSPNKTVGGALGALLGTTALIVALGYPVFHDTPMASLPHLLGLGLVVSLAGQLGDLVISSIKRDLGIKDMGNVLPGHGGFLDRFDSLLLVAPAFFHYVGYFNGIGLDQPARLFTGG